jgi:hypothetical protein
MRLVQPLTSVEIDGRTLSFRDAMLITETDLPTWQVTIAGPHTAWYALRPDDSGHRITMSTADGARLAGRIVASEGPVTRLRLIGAGPIETLDSGPSPPERRHLDAI